VFNLQVYVQIEKTIALMNTISEIRKYKEK